MKICFIGSGWYGIQGAIHFASKGHNVTIFEKNTDILYGTSGKFGIRLHAGPHYPRSKATRLSCRKGLEEFKAAYPNLLNEHKYAIYGLGNQDADGKPSKVTKEQFEKVCKEFKGASQIDYKEHGYQNLLVAYDLPEPSIVLGEKLRIFFKERLQKLNVRIKYNAEVTSICKINNSLVVKYGNVSERFDKVVNTTGYQSLLPISNRLPFRMKIVYQPCLALFYKEKSRPQANQKPFSFIVMDGWFPCIMPYDDKKNTPINYILTHGKYTILGSYDNPNKAKAVLKFISKHEILEIKKNCEREINRFWPKFTQKFDYFKYEGSVLAKMRTDKEFRSAVAFAHKTTGIIYNFPGKINNIFDIARETEKLALDLELETKGEFQYCKDGLVSHSLSEMIEAPHDLSRSTCDIQREAMGNAVVFPDFPLIFGERLIFAYILAKTVFTLQDFFPENDIMKHLILIIAFMITPTTFNLIKNFSPNRSDDLFWNSKFFSKGVQKETKSYDNHNYVSEFQM